MTSDPRSPAADMQAGLAKHQQGHHYPTVFNRLQDFLSPPTMRPGDTSQQNKSTPIPSPRKAQPIDPKFLKVRILTWNMHDSLPKGDLEELLGKVPAYNGPATETQFPRLSNDGNHPYHIVVVAGQECPTPSGIPMGLGAGFKILDKDRDKSKDSEKDNDRISSKLKDKHDDGRLSRHEEEFEAPPIGWTSLVEDWLCNGSGYCRASSPTTADVGFPRPLIRQKSSKDSRKGPYQLLIKDRLMGIYLAIYIHRDLKPFVQGTSKSAVTAGLIGGRVGNKGGVGISMKIDGTTFLFLNAHLAAHEGKVHHRQANLAKIKSHLSVDDFLSPEDPRKLAEDLTDKFDFSFLCGDLNFRLNLSRLHADWLIERGEYAQAFEFDQLHLLMKSDKNFTGFHEAPINFPPTFKYDVLRSVKSIKSSKRSSTKRGRAIDRIVHPTDIEERERETQDEDGDEDVVSLASTATGATSLNSQSGPESTTADPRSLSSTPATTPGRASSASKISLASSGAHKAKAKFLSLLSPSFIHPTDKLLKVRSNPEYSQTPTTPIVVVPPSPTMEKDEPITVEALKKSRPPPMILVNSPDSPRHPRFSKDSPLVEKGIYDSSSKKRVPSWCDRILWKTTIAPPPPPPQIGAFAHELDFHRPRNRMGQFFANAFRPPHPRGEPNNVVPVTSSLLEDDTPTPTSGYSSATPRGYSSTSFSDHRHQMNNMPSKSFHPQPRRTTNPLSPPPTAPPYLESNPPRRADTVEGLDRPHTSTHQSKWRGLLPSFLSPTYTQDPVPEIQQPSAVKGDVKCLSYNTLDDLGMRRLEGRSDHRPVIGAYLVYV